MNNVFVPLRVKLYPYEAILLKNFLLRIDLEVCELKGKAYNGSIVLSEWFHKYYMQRSIAISNGSTKIAKRIDVPLSVARYLLDEMTQRTIPIDLNIILGQIHRDLLNRNFLPES